MTARLPSAGEIDVLVTVKAAPQPSKQYRDTVCVAGLWMPDDGASPSPIRLYPVPYRYLSEDQEFSKWSIVRVEVAPSPRDPRAESRKVVIQPGRPIVKKRARLTWKQRASIVERVDRVPMCELLAGVRQDPNADSLGLVEPVPGSVRLVLERSKPLAPAKERARALIASQGELNLFDEDQQTVARALEQPPLTGQLAYRCTAPSCRGHQQGILDWEFTAAQLHFTWNRRGQPGDLEQMLRDKFERNPFQAKKRPLIIVGNQANPARRGTFSVLGLYYPDTADLPAQPGGLF